MSYSILGGIFQTHLFSPPRLPAFPCPPSCRPHLHSTAMLDEPEAKRPRTDTSTDGTPSEDTGKHSQRQALPTRGTTDATATDATTDTTGTTDATAEMRGIMDLVKGTAEKAAKEVFACGDGNGKSPATGDGTYRPSLRLHGPIGSFKY